MFIQNHSYLIQRHIRAFSILKIMDGATDEPREAAVFVARHFIKLGDIVRHRGLVVFVFLPRIKVQQYFQCLLHIAVIPVEHGHQPLGVEGSGVELHICQAFLPHDFQIPVTFRLAGSLIRK